MYYNYDTMIRSIFKPKTISTFKQDVKEKMKTTPYSSDGESASMACCSKVKFVSIRT